MSEQDDITKPVARSLQPFSKEPPPLATPRYKRDPSDATLAANERTVRRGSELPVLLGRSSARKIVGPGIVQDGTTIIVDVTAESVK